MNFISPTRAIENQESHEPNWVSLNTHIHLYVQSGFLLSYKKDLNYLHQMLRKDKQIDKEYTSKPEKIQRKCQD